MSKNKEKKLNNKDLTIKDDKIVVSNTDNKETTEKSDVSKKLITTKQIIFFVVTGILSIFSCLVVVYVYKEATILKYSLISVIAALYIAYFTLSFFKKTATIAKLLLTSLFFIFILAVIFAILKLCGVIEYFSSAEKIRNLILSTGLWGIIIFIVLQIAQVVVSPIPGMVTIAVGAQVFGPLASFAYSSIGIILGSLIAFSIGRLFSEKVALLFMSKEDLEKYRHKLTVKGKYLLPLIFLFPFFPDDIVCIVAGVTTIKFSYFLLVTLITRPISILISSYFMSGQIIPFKGWGLIVWAILIIIIAVLFWLVTKYGDKIEDFFLKRKNKKKAKKKETK